MHRTAHAAVIFASLVASVATLGLALAPTLASHDPGPATRGVELPRVVVSGTREPRVVELERVVVQGRRIAAPAASMAGLAQPLQPVLARQPH